ncbi:glutamine amidotransferase-related protein, partial [Bacillus pumilus]
GMMIGEWVEGERVVVSGNEGEGGVFEEKIEEVKGDFVMIWGGGCSGDEGGISMEGMKEFGGRIPMLGVWVGHEWIGEVFGGDVVGGEGLMDGKR